MRSAQEVRELVEKNRDEINNLLTSDLPIGLIYFNIRKLTARNERLLNSINIPSLTPASNGVVKK